jgi:hypothetical protein
MRNTNFAAFNGEEFGGFGFCHITRLTGLTYRSGREARHLNFERHLGDAWQTREAGDRYDSTPTSCSDSLPHFSCTLEK